MSNSGPDSSGQGGDGGALPEILAERSSDFSDRDWVFGRIAHWLDGDDSRLFLITGEPGAGKTALVAHLVELNRRPGKTDDDLAHAIDFYWVCQYLDTLRLDPIEF